MYEQPYNPTCLLSLKLIENLGKSRQAQSNKSGAPPQRCRPTATTVSVSAHFLFCFAVLLISLSSFLPDFCTFLWSITTFLIILNHTATHYYTAASNCLYCQAW